MNSESHGLGTRFNTIERRPKRAPRTMEFTELALKRLNVVKLVAKAGKEAGKPLSQVQIWDTGTNGQRGPSVLVSSGGTKDHSWSHSISTGGPLPPSSGASVNCHCQRHAPSRRSTARKPRRALIRARSYA